MFVKIVYCQCFITKRLDDFISFHFSIFVMRYSKAVCVIGAGRVHYDTGEVSTSLREIHIRLKQTEPRWSGACDVKMTSKMKMTSWIKQIKFVKYSFIFRF